MKKEDIVIGIDGGGTKTLGILADLDGKILARASGGTSNLQVVGVEGASHVVLEVVQDCCSRIKCRASDLKAVVVGLAGAGREPDRRRAQRGIHKLARKKNIRLRNLRVESDARVALEGALNGEPGIVLISGTGSIGFAKDKLGDIHRVGGWGRAIGDEGSGYAVGRQAIAGISKDLDGRGVPTRLTAFAAKEFQLSNPVNIVSKIYQDQFDVSTLAPLVLEAARRGDKVSRRILDEAVFELTDHVRALLTKMRGSREVQRQKKIRLALLGGMLEHPNYLSKNLKKKIRAQFSDIQIQAPKQIPAYGAVLMALSRVKESGKFHH